MCPRLGSKVCKHSSHSFGLCLALSWRDSLSFYKSTRNKWKMQLCTWHTHTQSVAGEIRVDVRCWSMGTTENAESEFLLHDWEQLPWAGHCVSATEGQWCWERHGQARKSLRSQYWKRMTWGRNRNQALAASRDKRPSRQKWDLREQPGSTHPAEAGQPPSLRDKLFWAIFVPSPAPRTEPAGNTGFWNSPWKELFRKGIWKAALCPENPVLQHLQASNSI